MKINFDILRKIELKYGKDSNDTLEPNISLETIRMMIHIVLGHKDYNYNIIDVKNIYSVHNGLNIFIAINSLKELGIIEDSSESNKKDEKNKKQFVLYPFEEDIKQINS